MKKIFLALLGLAAFAACDKEDGGDGKKSPSYEPIEFPGYFSEGFMKGSTMCFASYEQDAGLVYRDADGTAADPYELMKRHGANIVRLQLNYEDFSRYTSYNGASIDWATYKRVLADAKKARACGLDIMLTLKPDADIYHGSQSTDHNRLPRDWQTLSTEQINRRLHDWVLDVLYRLAQEGIFPRVVAVGNELNVEFLAPVNNYRWDMSRQASNLNAGLKAVREYAELCNPEVKSLLHVAGPSEIEWYMRDLEKYGCTDYDMVGVSWYPGEGISHKMGSGSYASFSGICSALKNKGCGFMVLETAYTFIHDRGDNCNNSYNYPAWNEQKPLNTSPAAQREWLRQLAEEVKNAGGLGVITWGTESLPSNNIYTYPADWAHGSTWENNSYWDFSDNNKLHEGIDWMLDVAE